MFHVIIVYKKTQDHKIGYFHLIRKHNIFSAVLCGCIASCSSVPPRFVPNFPSRVFSSNYCQFCCTQKSVRILYSILTELYAVFRIVGGGVQLGPLGTSATDWPIVPALGDYDDEEFGGMKIGRGNRSTRRKPDPTPLYRPQIPLDQTRARTRAATMGRQRLNAWAMARPQNYRFS
jgi:hypothetical protein